MNLLSSKLNKGVAFFLSLVLVFGIPLVSAAEGSFYTSQCNNDGECNDGENYQTCPLDCSSGEADDYCDGVRDGKCDSDCYITQDLDCINQKRTLLFLVFVAGVLILLIASKRLRSNRKN